MRPADWCSCNYLAAMVRGGKIAPAKSRFDCQTGSTAPENIARRAKYPRGGGARVCGGGFGADARRHATIENLPTKGARRCYASQRLLRR
jgi:hypothetical protein